MRLRSITTALSAVALSTLFAGSASAAIMVAKWSTTISRVGAPPALLPAEDTPFEITLTYDTELGDLYEIHEGQTWLGVLDDALIKATVSYGEELFDIDLADASSEQKYGSNESGKPFAYSSLSADVAGGGYIAFYFLTSHADAASRDLTKPFSGQIEGQGEFAFVTPGLEYGFDLRSTDGRPGRLTVSEQPTAPVPEPATWALMIAGFGLAGASLRRRRTVVVAA